MTVSIAFVFIDRPEPVVSAKRIAQDLRSHWPELQISRGDEEDSNGGAIAFQIGDAIAAIGVMPGPVPWSELEGPCSISLMWPDAEKEVPTHKTHLVATVVDDTSDPIEHSRLLTQLCCSAMATIDGAMGLFWASAEMVVRKDVFTDMALEVMPEGPPLFIWVNFRAGVQDGKTAGCTTGLGALGHMELETVSASEPPGELRERFIDIANYLLEHGPVIRDGDTLGQDEHERIKVAYADSVFQEGKVMRLDYTSTRAAGKKPWWRFW